MLNIRRLLQGLVLVAPVIATLLIPTAGTAAPIQPVGPITMPPMPTLVAVFDQQLLTDPGFEGTTPSGWIKTEGALPANAHKCGSRSMSLGFLGNAFFFQDVAIPANATSPNLSYYLRIDSTVASTSAVDTLEVLIKTAPPLPMAGTTLATLATYSNLDTTTNGQFVRRGNFDMSSYKGQTVRVWFQGYFAHHPGMSTQFFIDDTALWTRQHLSLNFC